MPTEPRSWVSPSKVYFTSVSLPETLCPSKVVVPASLAVGVAEELASSHSVAHGWLGITCTDAPDGDGAKVADAIPKWMNVVGLLVVAGVVLLFGNPIGLIFLVLGIFHTIGRFRRSNQQAGPDQAAASRRLGLGAAYVGILLVAAAGMSIANTAIVNSNSVPGVNQSTGTTVL